MHVLVVDDDLESRDLLRQALRRAGHEVLQALGTSDALRLSRLHPEIDVVVMDMHGQCRPSAMELTRALRHTLPHGHYVVASGDWDRLEPSCRGDVTVLRKPYGQQDLLRAVECSPARRALACTEENQA